MRICLRCKEERQDDEFQKWRRVCIPCRNDEKRGWQKKDPEKNREQSKKWRLENPEKAKIMQRNSNLKRKYGITIEQYDEILERQNHCCAVCRRNKSEFSVSLAVDHDHKTGEIFGLLCTFCNHRLIGRNRDPEKFLRAYEYLSKGSGLFVPPKKKRKKRKKK